MILQDRGNDGLNPAWTITPVGGSDKVPTFVALLGAQTDLNIAVLIDYQKKDRQRIDNLYRKKLLKKSNVLTYSDFVSSSEADIEDMLTPRFYLTLVNGAYDTDISEECLPRGRPRILHRIEQYLASSPLPRGAAFNHYRPASYLSRHIGALVDSIPQTDLERFQRAFDALNELTRTTGS